jgi:hypothetical protein
VKSHEESGAVVIGLIGGILAVVGVFLPWGYNVSGWDGRFSFGESQVYVIFIGGVLAAIGAIVALAGVKKINYLIPIGGIIAVIGWAWAVELAGTLSGWAYGFYLCLVGGILALIGGV